MLTVEEIGMNYLMMTIGALASLIDFGFAPQFGRNITYIFSGAQELKKEGIDVITNNTQINFRLLAIMIHTARFVYCRLAVLVLIVMLTFGSLYIYKITDGFTNVDCSFVIWIVYSISMFFNIYYSYYASLLIGKGLIMEAKKAMVYSKIAYILLTFLFLLLGMGLIGVVLANVISPFISRFISYTYFFTKEMKRDVGSYYVSKEEKRELLQIIWHNSKKVGIVLIGSYAVSRIGFFLSGLYFTLQEAASYGLMLQLVGLILTLSGTLFKLYEPKFAALRIDKNETQLLKDFSFSINIYMALFVLGTLLLAFVGQYALTIIGSNALLPSTSILLIYSLVMFWEGNHSYFSTFIITKNDIPFVKSSLISGVIIATGSYLSLEYTTMGILGLVLVQGLSQVAYSYWKWPCVVCKEFRINYLSFLKLGMNETCCRVKRYCYAK